MLNNNDLKEMCLSAQEVFDYIGIGKYLYGWHISDLKIYDKPKELSEFYKHCKNYETEKCATACYVHCSNKLCEQKTTRPPQSWLYVEEL